MSTTAATTERHTTRPIEAEPHPLENTFARAWNKTNAITSVQRETGIPDIAPEHVSEYLHRISGFPSLSGKAEASLARRIEIGVIADDKLDSWLDAPMPLVSELLLIALDGDTAYKLLIRSNLTLVVRVAKRFSGPDTPLVDLIEDGNRGLLHAIKTFDYEAGVRFAAHATPSIAHSMARGLVKRGAS